MKREILYGRELCIFYLKRLETDGYLCKIAFLTVYKKGETSVSQAHIAVKDSLDFTELFKCAHLYDLIIIYFE